MRRIAGQASQTRTIGGDLPEPVVRGVAGATCLVIANEQEQRAGGHRTHADYIVVRFIENSCLRATCRRLHGNVARRITATHAAVAIVHVELAAIIAAVEITKGLVDQGWQAAQALIGASSGVENIDPVVWLIDLVVGQLDAAGIKPGTDTHSLASAERDA
jgi:hypothetical protein